MELTTNLEINELVKATNIAELLTDEELTTIGSTVVKNFEADLLSRTDWEKRTESSLKLALQVVEHKNFPWPNASNIKFPLITIAALQYHARAYPVLVSGETPVRCRVYGQDPEGTLGKRAERISSHMSYQILEEDEDWESETDKVLITQPIVGCAFKKTYFDPFLRKNISENVLARDLVVNYYTKSLDTAPRITHILNFHKNDVYERVASGLWLEMKSSLPVSKITSKLEGAQNKAQGLTPPQPQDDTTPFEILEQHCFIDFDGDGYAEPYIVFVRRDTKQVLRIVARFFTNGIEYVRNSKKKVLRITAEKYFTKYPFIPSPDGGFYDLGFGVLLGPLNESINTIINQLVDAGTMANTAGGFFSRGIKFRGGNYSFAPLEWKHVDSTGDDLRKGIMPLPVREPSQVLFTLLSLLINYGERIGGAVDILVGESPGQNTPAETSRNMAEQGMKIFSGIFKRTYRSLKDEFRKMYRLNQLYLDQEVEFDTQSGAIGKVTWEDYQVSSLGVRPAADPNIVSDSQRMLQANAIKEASMTSPGFDIYQVNKRYLEAWKVPAIEEVLPDPKGPNAIQQGPSEKVQIEMMKLKADEVQGQLDFKLAVMELMQQAEEGQARIKKLEADAIKAIEEAKGISTGHEVSIIQGQLAIEKSRVDGTMKAIKGMLDIKKAQQAAQKPASGE